MKIMRFIGIVFALFSAGSPSDTSAQDSGKKYKVYMVSNSHLDTQWRWDVKATIDDYLYNTAVQNLALLEKYPHYVFNFEGAVKYEGVLSASLRAHPEIRSRRAMEHFGGFVRGQRPEHAVVGVVYPQHPACTGVL